MLTDIISLAVSADFLIELRAWCVLFSSSLKVSMLNLELRFVVLLSRFFVNQTFDAIV